MALTPLTRSSYHADEDFAALQNARNASIEAAARATNHTTGLQ